MEQVNVSKDAHRGRAVEDREDPGDIMLASLSSGTKSLLVEERLLCRLGSGNF